MSIFSPIADTFETVRRFVVPVLGKVVVKLNDCMGTNLYVHGKSHKAEFVGRLDMGEEQFEQFLQKRGFERNPLASLKKFRGETEEGSFRRIPRSNDEELDEDQQLHVIIYDGSKRVDAPTKELYVFAHVEYRWDRKPLAHYRGVDQDDERGVELMRRLLDEHQVPYNEKL